MTKGRAIVWMCICICLAAVQVQAKGLGLQTMIQGLTIGQSFEKVSTVAPGLVKSKIQPPGMNAYEMPDPGKSIVALKCAFKNEKLVLISIETGEGAFDKAKSELEAKYGAFSQPADSTAFQSSKDNVLVRLIRSGENGDAARIIIGNPADLN
jgi:hypothetical protein